MFQIAMIEDRQEEVERVRQYLDQYGRETGQQLRLEQFPDALSFLEKGCGRFDIVLMDVCLPGIDGMEAARRLRQADQKAVLIFMTGMAQYAADSYEVGAQDYLVKPARYEDFARKLGRALDRCRRESAFLLVQQQSGVQRLLLQSILYLEVQGHRLSFHTGGQVVTGTGTLAEAEAKLKDKGFLRCNKGFLVNARYIQAVQGLDLILTNGETLPISRPRKKAFMSELAEAMRNGMML